MLSITHLALLTLPLVSSTVAQSQSSETILAAYLFHRHGDRTAKLFPPTVLTSLGYRQVYSSGQFYASRYLSSTSDLAIRNLSSQAQEAVAQTQFSISAPIDTVLQNSALGFTQGLFPPLGASVEAERLRNGQDVHAPLGGYQLVPVQVVEVGSGSEDSTWLQDASGCANAELSSNAYFQSTEYKSLDKETEGFYRRLLPVVKGKLPAEDMTFENAYTIYDLINVATIHNSTIQHASLLDDDTLSQLRTLSDAHEYGLAYNASSTIRAIAGRQLAAEIVDSLESTISAKGASTSPKFTVQFGPYGTFMSLFGLTDLPSADVDFTGVPGYASSMAFELFTTAQLSGDSEFPDTNDLRVRFLFNNGSEATNHDLRPFPLFGTDRAQNGMSWTDFKSSMAKFAVGGTKEWCHVCGNSTGTCAQFALPESPASSSQQDGDDDDGGMSLAVAGVIGAMVTLAVILGAEAALVLLGGLRLVSKKRLAAGGSTAGGAEAAAAAKA